MSAAAPESNIDDLSLRITVTVNNTPIKDNLEIISVYVLHEINKISIAEIVLNGEIDIENATLEASDGDDFAPGNEIKITAGYGDKGEKAIFEGVIVKHGIDINAVTSYSLRLFCKHKAVRMTFNRNSAEFKDKTDSAVITTLFGTYGLSCTVDSTSIQNENFFQKLATDWDIILSRAEFNGFIVLLDGETVKVGKPVFTATPVLRVAAGESIIAFNAELNVERQAPSIEASAWDSKTQALLKSTATEPAINAQGNLKPKDLSAKLSQVKLSLNAAAALTVDELKAWADGKLLRMRLSAFKGRVSFIGNAEIKTGGLITLEGVGKKFNGDAFAAAVIHELEEGLWKTTVKFGLESRLVAESPDFSYAPATGLLPSVQGLQIGTVKKLSSDPQSAYRVLVTLPSGAQNANGLWARMANFYATSSAGLGFLPEVNDEVVIGFLDNDPRFPVILGSLYSSKNAAPNPAADENNYIKSITTKSKLKVSFDYQHKIIKIETPGANTITISDQDKAIEIKDQNSNHIKMSAEGISLSSPKDITIDTKGSLKLTAVNKITLAASAGDTEISGLNVKHTAQIGFTAKGNATAELSASGQTTVKGALVMIN
jgi:Rhs element Vgr protein